ncbi:MAG: histidine kinase [Segetibacter sp.]
MNPSNSVLVSFIEKHALPFLVRTAIVCLYNFSIQAQEAAFYKIYFHPNEQITGNYVEVKENNLPIKNTDVIYQSSDQTVWMGTIDDGLIAYTGNFIKHYRFDPKNKNSLPSNRVLEIWEESPCILWITTVEGIAKFNRLSGQFTRFASNSRYVRKSPDGVLYTSVMAQGLFNIDTLNHTLHSVKSEDILSEKNVSYPEGRMMSFTKLEFDKEGTLWAVASSKTLGGLFHFDFTNHHWIFHAPDTCYERSATDPLRINKKMNPLKITAFSLFIDDSDHIWFGGWGEGLFCYHKKNSQWQQYNFYRNSFQNNRSDNDVLAIYPLNKNELWIGSSTKGFVFNPQQKRVYNYTYLEGVKSPLPFQIEPFNTLIDHCGNRWIASESGIFKYNRVQTYFSASDGLKKILAGNSLLTAFYEISPEHYLAGISRADKTQPYFRKEIYEINKGHIIRRFSLHGVNESTPLRQFIPAGANEFYAFDISLHKLNLNKGSLQKISINVKDKTFPEREYADYYNTIPWNDSILFTCMRTTDFAGLVKVNLKKREAQFYKTSSTQLSPKFPQDNAILRLMKDSYSRIWCSAAGGLDIFYPDKDIFEHYYSIEGDTTSLLGQQPRFCETSNHTFYIASRAGVCATKAVPGTRATFTPIAYLDCDWIIADKTNMLWVGTPQGVARINPVNKTYKLFDSKDGYYWDAYRKPLIMPDGRFLMHDGVIIDPAAILQNTFKPVPRVSDFLVAGQPFSLDTAIEFKKHIRLKNDQNFFSISYTCNNYIIEEENTYRYKLQGIDQNWIEAGSRTMAYYTALAPGTYYFYVQAANDDGIRGEPKKLLTLTIVPAWYQTWWFKTAIALLIVAALYALYRQQLIKERAKHLAEKRAAELKQREAELKQIKTEFEKQLAETEMTALRSQMNPHFIFNVLNSINKYILSNDKHAASDYLVQFSRLIRLTLENSKAAKVPLQNDLEALRIYIEMEKLRFGDKFTCSIKLEENIDPQYLHIPPMLIQPYVENAIWHGLMQEILQVVYRCM